MSAVVFRYGEVVGVWLSVDWMSTRSSGACMCSWLSVAGCQQVVIGMRICCESARSRLSVAVNRRQYGWLSDNIARLHAQQRIDSVEPAGFWSHVPGPLTNAHRREWLCACTEQGLVGVWSLHGVVEVRPREEIATDSGAGAGGDEGAGGGSLRG